MIVLEVMSAILIAFKIMKMTDVSIWICVAPLIASVIVRIYVAYLESKAKEAYESKIESGTK